jgi:hypothetical protein
MKTVTFGVPPPPPFPPIPTFITVVVIGIMCTRRRCSATVSGFVVVFVAKACRIKVFWNFLHKLKLSYLVMRRDRGC